MEEPLEFTETSIFHLPDDCLSRIFQCLNCISDRDSFGLTCRRWLNIQSISRQSLQFQCSLSILDGSLRSPSNLDVSSYHLHRLLSRFQHLDHLSLSGCTDLPDSSLVHLQSYGSKLHSLYLDCCFEISDVGIFTIANACPSLSVISLYRCNVSDTGLKSLAEASLPLTRLNFSYCPLVSDYGIKALTHACSQLEAINISNCQYLTGLGFAGCSPSLVYVDAESCVLKPKGISEIISGGGIEFLNVSGPNSYICRDGLVPLGSGIASRLRILNLRTCRSIGDESILAIAAGCPLLQEWNLALCHGVTVPGWEAIGKYCNSLQKLHVNRCRNLCDRGLQGLRDGCRSLHVLHMSGNSKLSDVAVEMFRLSRADVEIRSEEVMSIGPAWNSRI